MEHWCSLCRSRLVGSGSCRKSVGIKPRIPRVYVCASMQLPEGERSGCFDFDAWIVFASVRFVVLTVNMAGFETMKSEKRWKVK